jgi:CRP-like cAMP-binding protein
MPKARRRTWLPPRQDKALVDDGAPAKDGTDAEAPVRRKCEAEGPTKFPSNLMDVMIEALQAGMMLLGQVPSVAAPAPAESPSVPTGNAGTGVTFETAVWEEEKEPPAPAFRMDFHDVMAGGEWDEAEKEAKKKKPVKGGKGLKWNARLESIHERASLIKPDRDDVTEPPQIGEVGIGGGGEKPGAKVRGRRGSSAEIATRTLESIGRSFNSGKHLHAAKLGAFRRESVVSALDDPTSTYVHGRARAASVIASSPAKSRSASMLGRKMSRRESRKMSRMSRKGSRLFAAISEAGVDAVPLRHRRASGGREKLPAVAAARGGQPDGGGGGAKQRHASAALMADLGALGQLIEDPTDLQTRLRQSALVSAVPQVAALPARLQTEISRACECRWYSARQEVLGYGLPLDALYVIRSGRFSTNAKIIDYGDYVMREYTEGMLLGEHALSETVPSPVGICCVEPGEMYILYGEDYRKLAEGELTTTTTEHAVDSNDASDTLARRTEAFLEKLPCCLPVPSATLASLAAEMEEGMSASLVSLKQTFSDAHNDASLLVLKGGKLTVTLPRPKAEGVKVDVMDARSITFQQGDVLGALAISTIYTCLEVASANERFASGRCTILKVGSAHGHLVPPTMRAEGDRCYTRKVLRATEFAKSMGVDEVDELLDAAGPPVVFPPGALITRQGLAYDEFHVMISGVARAFVNIAGVPMNGDAQSRSDGEGGDTTVGYFGASDHFGGVSILDPDSVRKVSVAAAAGSEVRCLTLTKETLAKVNLLSRLRHLLARDFANRKWTLETKKSAPLMHNLLVGGTIGQGSFGTVKIAQDKQSASTYALKTMKKLQVSQRARTNSTPVQRKAISTTVTASARDAPRPPPFTPRTGRSNEPGGTRPQRAKATLHEQSPLLAAPGRRLPG